MRLVLMGPPGAGKGTQGELLAQRYGVPRFSTGDILRAARRDGTELGREAQRYMDAGELVPDELILGMMRETLSSVSAADGFLLDGFPRTVAQAEGLDRLLSEIGRDLDVVVNLEVPDAEIIRRLSSRRVCADCEGMAPAGTPEGVACACGGELRTRSDDDPETVRRRLQVYHDQTEPVLAWYRASETPVQSVPGSGAVEDVQERVVEALAA
ncbi:MAG: adenylate kinase [Gemmatimonadota bacterium]